MRLGMIGLGRMGANMTRRLVEEGHEVVVHDRDPQAAAALAGRGVRVAGSIPELTAALEPPRVVWVMVPAGEPTEAVVTEVGKALGEGDVVVDGGNSHYRDSQRRAESLSSRGIGYVDCGTSGGIFGLEQGYCLMAGGRPEHLSVAEPVLRALAIAGGYAHVGPPGAGHFVKMVHNGIEYGLLQSFAEGFELLGAADEFTLDLAGIAELWRHGSVVRSWLLDLLAESLAEDPELSGVRGWVDDSGEGRWTVQEAVERGVPATAVAHALFARFASRQPDSPGMRVIASLRRRFGGHPVRGPDV